MIKREREEEGAGRSTTIMALATMLQPPLSSTLLRGLIVGIAITSIALIGHCLHGGTPPSIPTPPNNCQEEKSTSFAAHLVELIFASSIATTTTTTTVKPPVEKATATGTKGTSGSLTIVWLLIVLCVGGLLIGFFKTGSSRMLPSSSCEHVDANDDITLLTPIAARQTGGRDFSSTVEASVSSTQVWIGTTPAIIEVPSPLTISQGQIITSPIEKVVRMQVTQRQLVSIETVDDELASSRHPVHNGGGDVYTNDDIVAAVYVDEDDDRSRRRYQPTTTAEMNGGDWSAIFGYVRDQLVPIVAQAAFDFISGSNCYPFRVDCGFSSSRRGPMHPMDKTTVGSIHVELPKLDISRFVCSECCHQLRSQLSQLRQVTMTGAKGDWDGIAACEVACLLGDITSLELDKLQ